MKPLGHKNPQIFAELVGMEDKMMRDARKGRGCSMHAAVKEARLRICRVYDLIPDELDDIIEDGIDAQWPPLSEVVVRVVDLFPNEHWNGVPVVHEERDIDAI